MAVTTIVNPVPPLNFRDIGGLPTDAGTTTQPNVLFRSDVLYAGDQPGAEAWPPTTVLDLRRAQERTEFDLAWPDTTTVHHLDLLDPIMTSSSRSLAELYLRLLTAGAVVADYLASGATARRRRERVAAFGLELQHSAVPDEFFDVSADAINAVLDAVAGPASDGAISDWLIAHHTEEAAIAAWTQRLAGGQR